MKEKVALSRGGGRGVGVGDEAVKKEIVGGFSPEL